MQKRWIHKSTPNGTHNWIVHFCDGRTRVYFIYSLNRLNRFATIIRLLLLFSWFDFVKMAMNHAETVNTLNSLRCQHSTPLRFSSSANNNKRSGEKRELFNFYSEMRRFSLTLQNPIHISHPQNIWFPYLPSLLSNNIHNFHLIISYLVLCNKRNFVFSLNDKNI